MHTHRPPASSLLLVLSLTGACATEGYRADGGGCPAGEVCSGETPEGLLFQGTSYAGTGGFLEPGLKTIAAGGVQSIYVMVNDENLSPLDRPFDASVDGAGMAVTDTAPPGLVVTAGAGEGFGVLRIADPFSGELFDQVELQAQAVSSVRAFPIEELPASDYRWAMLAGSRRDIYVELVAATEERLADESLTIAVDGATAEQMAWDTISIGRDQAGTAVVTATGGDGVAHQTEVAFVDSFDSIELDAESSAQEIPVDSIGSVCFSARAGDAEVIGATWTYQVEGSIELVDLDQTFPCAFVQALAVGPATVTAKAGGHQLSFDLEVVEQDAPQDRAALRTEPVVSTGTPGVRARR